MLMKKIVLAAVAALSVSCGIEEISRRPLVDDGKIWTRPGAAAESGDAGKEEEVRTVTYITALDYPEGYDWRIDRDKGTVKCSLVVYKDDLPVLKVPVGDEYEVSSDPDMHRMVKGRLYTDFSTDSETVIKRDGESIIRYSGREMIYDILEHKGDVYTLGQSRSGKGFTYRKNGSIILERSEGRSFGRLHQDGDTISFAFIEPVESITGPLDRYYMSNNGKVVEAVAREDVSKVWDIVIEKGEPCYLASVDGISFPLLYLSGKMYSLNMPLSSALLAGRIFTGEGMVLVEGLVSRGEKLMAGGFWSMDGESLVFADGMTISSLCMDGRGVCCILNGPSGLSGGLIYRCGETYPMPQGYYVFGSSPAAVVNGILHVGLSSITCAPPAIWKDGETTPLKINGFISSISTDR